MKAIFRELHIQTKERAALIDITNEVEDVVRKSGVNDGLCLVQSLHSTASIIVNEHERGLLQDILTKVAKDFPKCAGWLHDRVDDNADAHLASTFLSFSKTFAVKDKKLLRGSWQNIFLLELDGPRIRTVVVEVLGE